MSVSSEAFHDVVADAASSVIASVIAIEEFEILRQWTKAADNGVFD
jgi:hypothetical protein